MTAPTNPPGTYDYNLLTVTDASSTSCMQTITGQSASITITQLPTASISYDGNPFCQALTAAQPVTLYGTGVYTSGEYSAPAGLTINSSTGIITPSTSTAGTYPVTYKIAAAGGCADVYATTMVTITTPPTASIAYSSDVYCNSDNTPEAVTIIGTSGGTFTASPGGLTIDAAGTIFPAGSLPGDYEVTYTISAAGGCGPVDAKTVVTITDLPTAAITYPGTPFCTSDLNVQSVILTGTGDYTSGAYSSNPVGLNIDATTGAIQPNTSSDGSYTVTYTIPALGGCPPVTATTEIIVTTPPDISFSYTESPYCQNGTNPFPSPRIDGSYTSTAGLVFANPIRGRINLSQSVPGTYVVTNTVPAADGCGPVTATATITITAAPNASISYSGSPFCQTITTEQAVIRTGTAGGAYTATPAGLSINAATGAITPNTSTAGTYTITYTVAAAGGCSAFTTSTTVDITAPPNASFSYSGSPFCSNAANPTPTGFDAGTFSASPGGIDFVSTLTGEINIARSLPGNYVITKTVPGSGGCGMVTATFPITINPRPAITADYCSSAAPMVRLTASGAAGSSYQWLSPLSGTGNIKDVDMVGTYGVRVTKGSCVEDVYLTANPELIVNGSFTAGNTGFTSDYTYYADDPNRNNELVPDNGTNGYGVGTNGQNYHSNFWGVDHTNNATGNRNFMLVNGHGTLVAWRQSNIPVVPGTTYYFSAWAISLNSHGPFAELLFTINGSTAGMTQTSSGVLPSRPQNNSVAPWTRFYGNWTAPAGVTSVTLRIVDNEDAAGGNDFGLDDISFGTLDPPPSTLLQGSETQTVCVNTAIDVIKYSTYKATGANISWSPSAPAGISISPITGNVVTISGIPTVAGTYNYTLTLSGCGSPITKNGSITVTPLANITSVNGADNICITETTQYTAIFSNGTGVWSTSNPSIATVNAATGDVTGVAEGDCDIIFTMTTGCGSPVSKSKPIHVNPDASIASVTGASPICIGETTLYTANTVVLGGGIGEWYSTEPDVATVDASGNVTAVGPGISDIHFRVRFSCGKNVNRQRQIDIIPNASIGSITGTSPMCINSTATFIANNVELGGGNGSWGSSNTAIAVINSSTGMVTALSAGNTTIAYTITGGCGGTVAKTFDLTVSDNVNPGVISGKTPLCINETSIFTTNGESGGAWGSSNPAVATVNAATGEVTAHAAGNCNITYTLSAGCGSPKFAVIPIVVNTDAAIASVSGATPLCIGVTTKYLANGVNLGGSGIGSWSSSNPAVATVDAAGNVTAVSDGSTDIAYSISGGCGVPVSQMQTLVVTPNAAITSVKAQARFVWGLPTFLPRQAKCWVVVLLHGAVPNLRWPPLMLREM